MTNNKNGIGHSQRCERPTPFVCYRQSGQQPAPAMRVAAFAAVATKAINPVTNATTLAFMISLLPGLGRNMCAVYPRHIPRLRAAAALNVKASSNANIRSKLF